MFPLNHSFSKEILVAEKELYKWKVKIVPSKPLVVVFFMLFSLAYVIRQVNTENIWSFLSWRHSLSLNMDTSAHIQFPFTIFKLLSIFFSCYILPLYTFVRISLIQAWFTGFQPVPLIIWEVRVHLLVREDH